MMDARARAAKLLSAKEGMAAELLLDWDGDMLVIN
jgi:hypothetical protein